MIEFVIDEEYDGVRLDRFLRKHLEKISLGDIFKMLRTGKIKVNKKIKKPDYRVILNDKIVIFYDKNIKIIEQKQEEKLLLSKKDRIFLQNLIEFESEDIFICLKPDNIAVHFGTKHNENLLSYFRSYFNSNNVNFVNRIDKSTSGLIIGVKNIKTARNLSNLIRENKIIKKYFVLVDGFIKEDEFQLKSYLKKEEDRVIEKKSFEEGYKLSISHFKKIISNKKFTLLEATLITGRTHQLRVQLSGIGHSIIGDKKYGKIKDKKMYLFSHYLEIPNYNIKIDLQLPNFFIEKLDILKEE